MVIRKKADKDPGEANRRSRKPEAEWFLILRSHWHDAGKSNRKRALRHIRLACNRKQPEDCLRQLEKGLQALKVDELTMIKLLVMQHLTLLPAGDSDTVGEIAKQMCTALESFVQAEGSPGEQGAE